MQEASAVGCFVETTSSASEPNIGDRSAGKHASARASGGRQSDRWGLDVVLNGCELRAGAAFWFGNRCSGSWRPGKVEDNDIAVAHAVACFAVYPMFMPAFDREYTCVKNGHTVRRRVVISDGGVYDNLGSHVSSRGDIRMLAYILPK